jgi:hypothetical protein
MPPIVGAVLVNLRRHGAHSSWEWIRLFRCRVGRVER